MAIKRFNHQGRVGNRINGMSVRSSLRILGVPDSDIPKRPRKAHYCRGKDWTFWADVDRLTLSELLHKAHRAYRQSVKIAHPDVAGGVADEAVFVNQVWDHVQKMFRNHGMSLEGEVPIVLRLPNRTQ